MTQHKTMANCWREGSEIMSYPELLKNTSVNKSMT